MSDIYEESMSQDSTSDIDCDSRTGHHHHDNDSSALTLQSGDDLYKSEGRNSLEEEESKHEDRHLMLLKDLKN